MIKKSRDLKIRSALPCFSLPTNDSELTDVGYVLAIENGSCVYISGDTGYHELLAHVRRLEPDVMITCMNSGFDNMSHWEAAELAGIIKPKAAIPSRYDIFPDNAADPQLFRAALRCKTPDVRYQQLEYVKSFFFKA
jgi:L-ascorbate metabolism protein UlaG (beta-lactamase superfamily)